MKRPEFIAVFKAEEQNFGQLNNEVSNNEKNDLLIDSNSFDTLLKNIDKMIDRKTQKIKSLRNYKQDLLVEICKVFDLPTEDVKCNKMRQNIQTLPIDRIISELEKYKTKNN